MLRCRAWIFALAVHLTACGTVAPPAQVTERANAVVDEWVAVTGFSGAVARDAFYAPTFDLWLAFSGTPEAPTLHLRSVFIVADAKRLVATAGNP